MEKLTNMKLFSLLFWLTCLILMSKTSGNTTDSSLSTTLSQTTTQDADVTSVDDVISSPITTDGVSTSSTSSVEMTSSTALGSSTQQMLNKTTAVDSNSQSTNDRSLANTTTPMMPITTTEPETSTPTVPVMTSSTSTPSTMTPTESPITTTTTTTTTTTKATTTTMKIMTTPPPTTMMKTTMTTQPSTTTTTQPPTTSTEKRMTDKVVDSTVVPETKFGTIGLPLFLITFAALICVLLGVAIYYCYGKQKSGTHYIAENGGPGGNVRGGPVALQMEGIDYGTNFETIDLEDDRQPVTETGLLSFKHQDGENGTGSNEDANSVTVDPPSWLRVEPANNEDTTSNLSTLAQTDDKETKPEVEDPTENNEPSDDKGESSDLESINSSALDENELPPPPIDFTDKQGSEEFKTEM